MALQAKTKLVDGQRIDLQTGTPFQQPSRSLTPPSITPQSLAPVQPFTIPPAPAATQAAGMLASIGAGADNFIKTQEKKAEQAKDNSDNMLGNLIGELAGQQGEVSLTSKAYAADEGVNDLQKELDDINSQLAQEQQALQRRIERIQDNAEGLETSGVEGRIREVERESLRKQADLAVIQMARQGRFDSAKEIADRAVAAQLEEQTNRLNTLQFVYEEYKDQFNKEEQRAFEAAQSERERTLQNEEYRLRAEFDQKIKQNDPEFKLRLENLKLQNKKLQQETGTNYDISNLTQEEFNALPAVDKNNTTLLQVFGSNKVSAGNKTMIGNALSLARSAQDLAGANPDASFAGLYPFRGVVDFFTPNAFKRADTIRNENYINSLNLQTQFWASGAALTEAQTALVMDMVPTTSDTDKAVKTKLNALVNYMMGQTASRLQTDGINFKPETVNLFETNDLLSEASEEQLEQLREQGLI